MPPGLGSSNHRINRKLKIVNEQTLDPIISNTPSLPPPPPDRIVPHLPALVVRVALQPNQNKAKKKGGALPPSHGSKSGGYLKNCLITAATRWICASVISGKIGRLRHSRAAFSATGKSPA